MKISTTKKSKKTISSILGAFERSRIAGIVELVGDKKVAGNYIYQAIDGSWIATGSSDLKKSMYEAGIDEGNINTVKVEKATSHKQLLQQTIATHSQAVSDERFANMLKGHAGINRPVRVYNTKTKTAVVVDSAYDAAKVVGTTRMNVYNRLTGNTKDNTIGQYKGSYSYSL